mmetsp:Transcript_21047/g.54383  ORF Transcript_21047/g.54383 Transcript_21047/m.54383 type:complete len:226 (+) Transcript_21047:1154-1831(+)
MEGLHHGEGSYISEKTSIFLNARASIYGNHEQGETLVFRLWSGALVSSAFPFRIHAVSFAPGNRMGCMNPRQKGSEQKGGQSSGRVGVKVTGIVHRGEEGKPLAVERFRRCGGEFFLAQRERPVSGRNYPIRIHVKAPCDGRTAPFAKKGWSVPGYIHRFLPLSFSLSFSFSFSFSLVVSCCCHRRINGEHRRGTERGLCIRRTRPLRIPQFLHWDVLRGTQGHR